MTTITIQPIGTVVGVVSDYNAALVRAHAIIVETSGGGSSTATTTKHEGDYIFPAKVLTRGSKGVKDYFNYEVGETVCLIDGGGGVNSFAEEMQIYAAEGRQYGDFYARMCFIAGAFYTPENRPPAYFEGVRLIDFGGGNYIEVNLEEKTLDINFTGEISINGKAIMLN